MPDTMESLPMFRSLRTHLAPLGLAALLAVGQAAAQPAPAQISAAEFAGRRDSLAARIKDGMVVAFGGRTPTTDFGPFYQLPAFHYLTNFDEPDAAVFIVVKGGKASTTIFLTPNAPRAASYYGRRQHTTPTERG